MSEYMSEREGERSNMHLRFAGMSQPLWDLRCSAGLRKYVGLSFCGQIHYLLAATCKF